MTLFLVHTYIAVQQVDHCAAVVGRVPLRENGKHDTCILLRAHGERESPLDTEGKNESSVSLCSFRAHTSLCSRSITVRR